MAVPEHGREHDDAVHVLDVPPIRTLCGKLIHEGMLLTRMFSPQPDAGSCCWTCMAEREKRCGDADRIIRGG